MLGRGPAGRLLERCVLWLSSRCFGASLSHASPRAEALLSPTEYSESPMHPALGAAYGAGRVGRGAGGALPSAPPPRI